MTKNTLSLTSLGISLSVALFLGPQAKAATLYWDSDATATADVTNGSGTWTTAGVWFNGDTSSNVNWNSFASPRNDAYFGFTGTTGSAGTITLPSGGVSVGNVTFGSGDPYSGFTLSSGKINFNGLISNEDLPNTSISSVLLGSGNVERVLGGTLTLSGVNTYSGSTRVADGATIAITGAGSISASSAINVENGTLLLNSSSSNVIGDAKPVTLGTGGGGVGTLQLSGNVTETVGTLTLSSAGQIIDFGSGSGALTLSALAGSGTLSIYNYTGGNIWTAGTTDTLFVSSGSLGSLSSTSIQFYSDAGSTMVGVGAGFIGNELVPVPEPAAIASALALIGPAFWRQRRNAQRRK